MEEKRDNRYKWQMLEMSDGITTSNGNWYHITRDGIKEYIPGLLQEYTLERIIKEADAWVKSADILSLYLYFILVLTGIGPLWAALISLFFFTFWLFNVSAFTNSWAGSLINTVQMDGMVYTLSGGVLIYLAFQGLMAPMWVGILLFFLYKVGLLRLTVNYMVTKNQGPRSGFPKPDRVLNMLLIRYGMKEGKLTGSVEEMEKELIRIATYHKNKKKENNS